MTSSGSSAVSGLLAGYLDGRVPPERLIPALAVEYYRTGDRKTREVLRPVMEIIERAAPGVGQLVRTDGGAGFDIRLAERPFPAADEAELRKAVSAALASGWGGETGPPEAIVAATSATSGAPGFISRLVRAVRRLFSASA
jgi:hypothetical protein